MADVEVAHLLSTSDNPWNPWTHFDEWLSWDMHHGYNTLPYLARIVVTSDELSDQDQDRDVEIAIKEILRIHSDGIYIAVPEPKSETS